MIHHGDVPAGNEAINDHSSSAICKPDTIIYAKHYNYFYMKSIYLTDISATFSVRAAIITFFRVVYTVVIGCLYRGQADR